MARIIISFFSTSTCVLLRWENGFWKVLCFVFSGSHVRWGIHGVPSSGRRMFIGQPVSPSAAGKSYFWRPGAALTRRGAMERGAGTWSRSARTAGDRDVLSGWGQGVGEVPARNSCFVLVGLLVCFAEILQQPLLWFDVGYSAYTCTRMHRYYVHEFETLNTFWLWSICLKMLDVQIGVVGFSGPRSRLDNFPDQLLNCYRMLSTFSCSPHFLHIFSTFSSAKMNQWLWSGFPMFSMVLDSPFRIFRQDRRTFEEQACKRSHIAQTLARMLASAWVTYSHLRWGVFNKCFLRCWSKIFQATSCNFSIIYYHILLHYQYYPLLPTLEANQTFMDFKRASKFKKLRLKQLADLRKKPLDGLLHLLFLGPLGIRTHRNAR